MAVSTMSQWSHLVAGACICFGALAALSMSSQSTALTSVAPAMKTTTATVNGFHTRHEIQDTHYSTQVQGVATSGPLMTSEEPGATLVSSSGLMSSFLLPVLASVSGALMYIFSTRPAPLLPVNVQLEPLSMEGAPIALAATSGAKALAVPCVWDPAKLLKNVVTFEREVEAQLLHGRYVLIAVLSAVHVSNKTASSHIPGWDEMQGLVYRSIFGLGAPEIAVIVITAGLVLGPKKLAELARDAGKVTGQLKDVTSEFQEAVQEGLKEAKEIRVEPKVTPVVEQPKAVEPKVEESKPTPTPIPTPTPTPEASAPEKPPTSA